MSDLKYLPQPYFLVDREYNIHDFSQVSSEIFYISKNFLDLVDRESQGKTKNILGNKESRAEGELTMITKNSPYALFDISVNWNGDSGHIICIEKDHRLMELESMVDKHRKRLSDTNLELLEKKELVEKTLFEIKSLSCPFIKLTNSTALVPLFGNLDVELIRQNEQRVLEKSQEGDYKEVLFDFNGVGNLTIEGVEAFVSLVNELQLMGLQPCIIGIKPNHAFYLNNSKAVPDVPFLNTLSKALNKQF
ncbi:STAS domain-containing protein [Mesobacillus subterraneus]|uniref:STAS domain-containing protein n=1 Tax=Mesobacillus subterraneus TaxID=285983 RepID=UPI001CFDB860|nr:STAS domain-containing protein [Mesobacillus subterraneus]WLR56914.1 STAS domain-containing protein [Mesobacillus subterraneus]